MTGPEVWNEVNETALLPRGDLDRVEVGAEAFAALAKYLEIRYVQVADREGMHGRIGMKVMTERGETLVVHNSNLVDAMIAYETTGEPWPNR